jgi:hypothetical protein
MSEQDATPAPSTALDDDEIMDILDPEEDDFEDGDFDLDDEPFSLDDNVVVQEFVSDTVDVGDGNGDVDVDVDVDVDDDDGAIEDDLLTDTALLDVAATSAPSMADERIARLEETLRVLTEAEQVREQGKVHRKVKAATTGAGAIGFVPILLQLIGALDLSPELAATAAAGAASLGALVSGYLTPEREKPVTETPEAQDLLDEGVDVAIAVPHRAHRRARAHRRRRVRRHRAG